VRRPTKTASTLSGGEKTKLALAQLVVGNNNLLLLDEPTTTSIRAPARRPRQRSPVGPGTMVIVSHDTDFVRQLRTRPRAVMP